MTRFGFKGFGGQPFKNSELGMRNAEKEMAECQVVIISAFRIPTSTFIYIFATRDS